MKLSINGATQEYAGEPTLSALLDELSADPARVATLLNDAVVRRDLRSETALQDGDRIELLVFAAGG